MEFAILATDVAVLTVESGVLKVLLTPAKSRTFRGLPALPGGLVAPKERTLAAAKRILGEVIASADFYIEQLYTFDSLNRDPAGRVVSVAYLMLIPWNKARLITKGEVAWYSVKSLPKLAYDHNEIVRAAVKRLIGKLTYTNMVFGLMPEEFTLTEIQAIYEAVLGRNLDKRNFRKKIKTLAILKKLAKKRKGDANRPAQLYGFKEKELKVVEVL